MWEKDFNFKGHTFSIMGSARSCHLLLSSEQIRDFGLDIVDFMEWAEHELDELGRATAWRLSDYDIDYDREEDLEWLISLRSNKFLTDTEREEITIARPKRISYARKQEKKSNPGYVYLIRGVNNQYKIGRATNIKDRLRIFGVQLPFDIEPIHSIYTEDMVALEKELHIMFDAKRLRGEWFALNEEDVSYIKGIDTVEQKESTNTYS